MATVEAKVFSFDGARLVKLSKEAEVLHPNGNALAASGIDVLFGDQSLRPENHWPRAKGILETWKQLKGMVTKEDVFRACDKPFRGMTSQQYMQIVAKVKSDLRQALDKKKFDINYKVADLAWQLLMFASRLHQPGVC